MVLLGGGAGKERAGRKKKISISSIFARDVDSARGFLLLCSARQGIPA
jgi:hypothetical protein